jgi:hypothetical protein
MSPERILVIVERFEDRIYSEFKAASDPVRVRYLKDRINHACFIRICCHLKSEDKPVPSMRQALLNKNRGRYISEINSLFN